jgi:hypothetical protein
MFSIKDLLYNFMYLYVAIYVTYIFMCWYEEYKIKKYEFHYKYYTKTEFYYEIFYIVIKYNPLYKRKNGYDAFDEAKKLYNENQNFRIECYKNGLKPRLLEIINKK